MAWDDYLAGFHADHPAITEAVLRRSRRRPRRPGTDPDAAGVDPYDWLLAAVPPDGPLLDLACGSAPLWPVLAGRGYVGLDAAGAELAAAGARGAGPLLLADATALPLTDRSVRVVVCSMGLMLFHPLQPALAEIARVLAPGGRLVATVPATWPLRAGDVPLVAGLVAALGRGLSYPADRDLRALAAHLRPVGLRLVADQRRRFGYRLRSADDADRLLASLYLPGLAADRRRLASRYLRLLARAGADLPVPLRRVVAVAERAAGPPGPAGRAPSR